MSCSTITSWSDSGNEDADSWQRHQLWNAIAGRMNEETVLCTDEHFIEHYLPPIPKAVKMKKVMKDLRKLGRLGSLGAPVQCSSKAKAGRKTLECDEAFFGPLVEVVAAIRDSVGISKNAFHLRMVRGTKIRSNALNVDACTTAIREGSKTLCSTDVVVPFNFDIRDDERAKQENRIRLVSAMVQIMDDDIRRNFAFGVTVEGDRLSLWYFSRSHSVKATSFSYIKDPEKLVHVLTALSCATEAELGYDPRITLLPDMSFLYEFVEKVDATRTPKKASPTYFKITTSLTSSQSPPLGIAGHTTRIFTAMQVTSKDDPTPLAGARDVVVKDVWIGADSHTEVQIQEALFADIEEFAKSAAWGCHPLLAEFSDEEKGAVGAWLPDERYKELFLCAVGESVGEECLRVHPEAWDSDDIFNGSALTEGETLGQDVTGSQRSRSILRTTAPPDRVGKGNIALEERRAFSSKKRCFFLFEDTCIRVSALPTLGDAMDVLRQTHLALILMFCAGWVHRDISSGNVLAVRKEGEASWQAKLADLEYAQKFPTDEAARADPKTGTLYFMAWEIHSSLSLFDDEPKPENASRRRQPTTVDTNNVDLKVVKHTCAHDLESLWWLVLFIVTSFVNHQESYTNAQVYFEGNNFGARLWLLSGGALPILHPDLHDFVRPLKDVRNILRSGYREINPVIVPAKLGGFAGACATYLDFFRGIEKSEVSWRSIPLRHSVAESGAAGAPAANVAQASNTAQAGRKKRKRGTKPDIQEPPRRSSRLAAKAAAKEDLEYGPGTSKKARCR